VKALLLFAFLGFVLAISQATPIREQDIQAEDEELKHANDLEPDNTDR